MIRTYFKRDVISQLQFFTLISFPRPSKKTRFLLVLSFPIIFDRLLLLQCGYFFLKLIGPNFLHSSRRSLHFTYGLVDLIIFRSHFYIQDKNVSSYQSQFLQFAKVSIIMSAWRSFLIVVMPSGLWPDFQEDDATMIQEWNFWRVKVHSLGYLNKGNCKMIWYKVKIDSFLF